MRVVSYLSDETGSLLSARAVEEGRSVSQVVARIIEGALVRGTPPTRTAPLPSELLKAVTPDVPLSDLAAASKVKAGETTPEAIAARFKANRNLKVDPVTGVCRHEEFHQSGSHCPTCETVPE